jgi:predicted dehydrogenase
MAVPSKSEYMESAQPLDILFVGCGEFAHRYHVPAITADETLHVAGIFDPFPSDATRALAKRYQAPVVGNIEELPASKRSAFAIVTTPHTLHARHIDAVLDRGWAVLVDKPFVMKSADAMRLARRADDAGIVNGVAYNRRFDPRCVRAREILRDGTIGAVRFVQTVQLGYERSGWFLRPVLGGGGPYTGRATHMADLIPWLLGRCATRVRSRLRGGTAERSDHGGFIEVQFGELECQMTCIEEGLHMWDEVRIFGDDGMIELRRPLTAPIGWSLTRLARDGSLVEQVGADTYPGDATRDFVAAIRSGRAPACTFAQAVPSVRLVEAAFDSARRGHVWIELEAT